MLWSYREGCKEPKNVKVRFWFSGFFWVFCVVFVLTKNRLQHIYNWSKEKNLKINSSKTREMAIIKRNRPTPLANHLSPDVDALYLHQSPWHRPDHWRKTVIF